MTSDRDRDRDRDRDARLVAAMAGGDSQQALGAFYDRFAGMTMALILRILGSRAEAEELLQEVFVELWRRAPDYDPGRAAVTTWVATVARSRALDALRARKRRHADAQVPSEDAALPAPASQRPDELASAGQRSRAVKLALAELSAEKRQVLELAYFGGMSHSEIAARIEIPVGTVKSRILAAMKVLRASLAASGGDA